MLTLRELLDKAPGAFVISVILTFLLYFKNINILLNVELLYVYFIIHFILGNCNRKGGIGIAWRTR